MSTFELMVSRDYIPPDPITISLQLDVRMVSMFVRAECVPPKNAMQYDRMIFKNYDLYYKPKAPEKIQLTLYRDASFPEIMQQINDLLTRKRKRFYFLRLMNQERTIMGSKEQLFFEFDSFISSMGIPEPDPKREPLGVTKPNYYRKRCFHSQLLKMTCFIFNKSVCQKLLPYIESKEEKEMCESFLRYGEMFRESNLYIKPEFSSSSQLQQVPQQVSPDTDNLNNNQEQQQKDLQGQQDLNMNDLKLLDTFPLDMYNGSDPSFGLFSGLNGAPGIPVPVTATNEAAGIGRIDYNNSNVVYQDGDSFMKNDKVPFNFENEDSNIKFSTNTSGPDTCGLNGGVSASPNLPELSSIGMSRDSSTPVAAISINSHTLGGTEHSNVSIMSSDLMNDGNIGQEHSFDSNIRTIPSIDTNNDKLNDNNNNNNNKNSNLINNNNTNVVVEQNSNIPQPERTVVSASTNLSNITSLHENNLANGKNLDQGRMVFNGPVFSFPDTETTKLGTTGSNHLPIKQDISIEGRQKSPSYVNELNATGTKDISNSYYSSNTTNNNSNSNGNRINSANTMGNKSSINTDDMYAIVTIPWEFISPVTKFIDLLKAKADMQNHQECSYNGGIHPCLKCPVCNKPLSVPKRNYSMQ